MAARSLRILLISPKGEFFLRSEGFRRYVESSREMQMLRHHWNGTGIALPTIAALTPGEHEITIIDENYEDIDFDRPCDLVGITAFTQQAARAYEIAGQFRCRDRHVAMGGIHATVMPDEAAGHVDTVFVGEGENTWPQFIADFLRGGPQRRYDQGNYPPVDLTRSPLPRYDLVARYHYPVVWLQTTRGCPHDCEFCAASKIYGRRYRRKSVEQVVAEVADVRSRWRSAQVGFADDNMFASPRFGSAIAAAFKPLNFSWIAQTDISVADRAELLAGLRESGCRILVIGLESVTKQNLRNLDREGWKERMFDRYPEMIHRIQSSGIGIYGGFILGLDHDDRDTAPGTAEFVNRNHILGGQLTILTPFPGSRLRERLEREKRILHHDWRWYTAWNAVIRHPNLSSEELEADVMHFYRSVFSEEANKSRAAYFRDVWRALV